MDGIAPKRPRARDGDLADMDDPLWNLVNNCWVRDPGNRPSSGTVLNTLLSSGRHITYRLRDEVTINTPESLLLAMGEGLSDICTCLSNDSDLRITLVQKTEAQLLICLEQRRVVFRILIVEPEFRIFFTIGNIAEEVINVVRAAAHYFFHLSCMPGSLALHQTIDVEAFRLVESEQAEEDLWFTRLLPQGGNMIHSKSGTSNMDLFVDDHAFYGFRITNNGDLPIYCNLFFFDSDFEIRGAHQLVIGPGAEFE
ncbi:hypothetical protein PHLCEN_2v256 [Hermanssonia centrifuga]|uniref:Uncharacterized protein n=1 Tax=Hermanssonia centrifuga TaxID=98765 RepID=A0A2R6S6K8_9APHY|nr:hypothetical protein PHLCEN_2v256 [Hermanssonia centrifuga]